MGEPLLPERPLASSTPGPRARRRRLRRCACSADHEVAGAVGNPQVVRKLLGRKVHVDQLTARETEVLALMAEEKANAAIARELFVSDAAVAKHINRIFAKLELGGDDSVHRRVQAVLAYLQS